MLLAYQIWSLSLEVEEIMTAWHETVHTDVNISITVCKLPNGVTKFRWQA